ncbi:hypothetical protein HELRODRAFT_193233 [Helobdella robusta]|uniref:Uncharacterized protein n=1 Tax=Helobdella robusta TaxID=6412 RepID=T1FUR9_HELRO|nr:hypothetical protein HELRODRAFT_193233 [Helobdella robusta]ESN97523.1 hypothetical protein HELRODRAFT_193233 [Helobdella robusta]
MKKYGNALPSMEFLPICIEVLGPMDPNTLKFLKAMCKMISVRSGDSRELFFATNHISGLLQRPVYLHPLKKFHNSPPFIKPCIIHNTLAILPVHPTGVRLLSTSTYEREHVIKLFDDVTVECAFEGVDDVVFMHNGSLIGGRGYDGLEAPVSVTTSRQLQISSLNVKNAGVYTCVGVLYDHNNNNNNNNYNINNGDFNNKEIPDEMKFHLNDINNNNNINNISNNNNNNNNNNNINDIINNNNNNNNSNNNNTNNNNVNNNSNINKKISNNNINNINNNSSNNNNNTEQRKHSSYFNYNIRRNIGIHNNNNINNNNYNSNNNNNISNNNIINNNISPIKYQLSYTTTIHVAYLDSFSNSSTHPPPSSTYVIGVKGRVEVTCYPPHGLPCPHIFWLNPSNEKLGEEGRVRSSTSGHMIIESAEERDAGWYTCVGQNVVGRRQVKVQLFVTVPPKVQRLSSVVTSHEGQAVTLECKYVGSPLLYTEISWKMDGQIMDVGVDDDLTLIESNTDRFEVHRNKLTILHAQPYDVGSYGCIIVTQQQTPVNLHIAQLYVIMKPFFTILPQNKTVLESDPLIISCDAEGLPMPSLEWVKGYGAYFVDDHRIKILKNGSLEIKSVRYEDVGWYSCHGVSEVGAVVQEFYIDVVAVIVIITVICSVVYIMATVAMVICCLVTRRRRKMKIMKEIQNMHNVLITASSSSSPSSSLSSPPSASTAAVASTTSTTNSGAVKQPINCYFSMRQANCSVGNQTLSYDRLVNNQSDCRMYEQRLLEEHGLDILSYIGEGCYGDVLMCRLKRDKSSPSSSSSLSLVMVKLVNNVNNVIDEENDDEEDDESGSGSGVVQDFDGDGGQISFGDDGDDNNNIQNDAADDECNECDYINCELKNFKQKSDQQQHQQQHQQQQKHQQQQQHQCNEQHPKLHQQSSSHQQIFPPTNSQQPSYRTQLNVVRPVLNNRCNIINVKNNNNSINTLGENSFNNNIYDINDIFSGHNCSNNCSLTNNSNSKANTITENGYKSNDSIPLHNKDQQTLRQHTSQQLRLQQQHQPQPHQPQPHQQRQPQQPQPHQQQQPLPLLQRHGDRFALKPNIDGHLTGRRHPLASIFLEPQQQQQQIYLEPQDQQNDDSQTQGYRLHYQTQHSPHLQHFRQEPDNYYDEPYSETSRFCTINNNNNNSNNNNNNNNNVNNNKNHNNNNSLTNPYHSLHQLPLTFNRFQHISGLCENSSPTKVTSLHNFSTAQPSKLPSSSATLKRVGVNIFQKRRMFEDEVELMKLTRDSTFFVQMLAYHTNFIAVEYPTNGNLRDFLKFFIQEHRLPQMPTILTVDRQLHFAHQITIGMHYLTQKINNQSDDNQESMASNRLKPFKFLNARNVVVSASLDVKICLPSACYDDKGNLDEDHIMLNGEILPLRWTSPELIHQLISSTSSHLQTTNLSPLPFSSSTSSREMTSSQLHPHSMIGRQPQQAAAADWSSDVWSLALLFVEIFTFSAKLFPNSSDDEVLTELFSLREMFHSSSPESRFTSAPTKTFPQFATSSPPSSSSSSSLPSSTSHAVQTASRLSSSLLSSTSFEQTHQNQLQGGYHHFKHQIHPNVDAGNSQLQPKRHRQQLHPVVLISSPSTKQTSVSSTATSVNLSSSSSRLRLSCPLGCPDELWNLIERCLSLPPQYRPNFNDISTEVKYISNILKSD